MKKSRLDDTSRDFSILLDYPGNVGAPFATEHLEECLSDGED